MPNRDLILSKIDLVRNALSIGSQHASLLRHAVQNDDVEGMTRSREMLEATLEMFSSEMAEICHELPDWRPAHTAQADGCGRLDPDARLGACEI